MFTTAGAALRTTGENPWSKIICVRLLSATVKTGCCVLLCTTDPVNPPTAKASRRAAPAIHAGVLIILCMIRPQIRLSYLECSLQAKTGRGDGARESWVRRAIRRDGGI